jgi:hypothetical protein
MGNFFLREVFKFSFSSSREMTIRYSYFYFQISYSSSSLKGMCNDSEDRNVDLYSLASLCFESWQREEFFYPIRSDRLWYAPVSYSLRGSFFSRSKTAIARSLQLTSTLSCTVHIKNEWSYTSTPSTVQNTYGKNE